MLSKIVLLKEENYEAFLPCIMPQIHARLAEPTVFGFGVIVTELDEPEVYAGAIVCEYDTGVATVLSVGVLPHFQRRGLGYQLVQYMAEACARQKFMELTANCWSADCETGAVEHFFADNGFEVVQGEGMRYVVAVKDIAGSALERHIAQVANNQPSSLVELERVPQEIRRQFVNCFQLSMDIFDEADPMTSSMTIVDGVVTGAALLSRIDEGVVEVIYLCAMPNDGRAVAAALLASLGKLYRVAPPDLEIVFTPINDVVTRLAQRLLEGCKVEVLHECQLYRPLLSMWKR